MRFAILNNQSQTVVCCDYESKTTFFRHVVVDSNENIVPRSRVRNFYTKDSYRLVETTFASCRHSICML